MAGFVHILSKIGIKQPSIFYSVGYVSKHPVIIMFRENKRLTIFVVFKYFSRNVCVLCRTESSHHHHSDAARTARQDSLSQPHGGDSALSQRSWPPGVWLAVWSLAWCTRAGTEQLAFGFPFALTRARQIRRAFSFSLTLISPFRVFFILTFCVNRCFLAAGAVSALQCELLLLL